MKKLFYTFVILLSATLFLKAQVSFTNPTFACANANVLLSGSSGTLSNPGFTWTANPLAGALFSSPNNSVSSASFTNAGTYTITLSANSGNTNSSFQSTINIGALPIVSITASSFTTCISSNFPLAGKPVTLTAGGAVNYSWTSVPANITNASQTVQINSTTCFSVTGEDLNGCLAMSIACVTVIPRFSISTTPSNTYVCYSNTGGSDIYVELTASDPSPPAFGLPSSHNYIWTGMGLITSGFQSTVKAFPMATMDFTAQIIDSLGCISLPAISTVSAFICMAVKHDELSNALVHIYPNPVSELLNIQLPTLPAGPLKLRIINLLGQCVRETSIERSIIELDVSELKKGAYFVKVITRDGVETAKFIKQ